jgi:hypothetical protein
MTIGALNRCEPWAKLSWPFGPCPEGARSLKFCLTVVHKPNPPDALFVMLLVKTLIKKTPCVTNGNSR